MTRKGFKKTVVKLAYRTVNQLVMHAMHDLATRRFRSSVFGPLEIVSVFRNEPFNRDVTESLFSPRRFIFHRIKIQLDTQFMRIYLSIFHCSNIPVLKINVVSSEVDVPLAFFPLINDYYIIRNILLFKINCASLSDEVQQKNNGSYCVTIDSQ